MNTAQLYVLAVASFMFGASLGSFLNVCLYRVPLKLSVVTPPSACPVCNHLIRPYDNIPMLSWLILRGKCRDCDCRIPTRYVLVELVVGILVLILYLLFILR